MINTDTAHRSGLTFLTNPHHPCIQLSGSNPDVSNLQLLNHQVTKNKNEKAGISLIPSLPPIPR